ncbi:VOC family protein [Rhodovulum adriaticum]|uniref:Putative glyoxalase superfamily protein PhnB n=1 Tax=Rhodovulum adriaticum TaxID=35804 RepID=A0A4R2NYN6_RHOAD|nr:VOC family protein [Rhodovulum adriaticum]MBK1636211.1 glyoxalase [Rhodovulum adriaticum]TCP26535.1 putative glyoxalase superfamily protein PhnB [Rhodovulum adriaticum]
MKLRYTILYVADVPATLDFYSRAFGLETGFLHESGDYGELVTGDTKLAFSSTGLMTELGKSPGTPDPAHPVFEIAFETDDVRAAFDRARDAGASAVQEPRDEPWGQTTAYVADPNGYLVELCTPVAM